MGSWQAMLRVHYANLPPCTQNHQNVPRLLSWNSCLRCTTNVARHCKIWDHRQICCPSHPLEKQVNHQPMLRLPLSRLRDHGNSLSYLCVSTLLSRGPTRSLKLSESLIRCSLCASIRVMVYYQNRKWIVSFLQRPMQMLKASYSMFVFDVYLR